MNFLARCLGSMTIAAVVGLCGCSTAAEAEKDAGLSDVAVLARDAGTPPATSPCGAQDGGHPLYPADVAHACVHIRQGPFVSVDARGEPPLPSLEFEHTLYTIGAIATGDARAPAFVSFRPLSTSAYVVYQTEAALVVWRDETGRLVCPIAVVEPAPGCEGFARAAVYQLSARTVYRLEFSISTSRALTMLIAQQL